MPAASDLRARVRTTSAAETVALGERLGRVTERGDLLCLWGDLGAGKTQLAKGIARGLDIDATVNSPTFILMNEYAGRLPMFHIDLYRLSSAREVVDAGLLDDRQAAGVVLIEWPDRLGEALPPERLDVHIDGGADEPRSLRLTARGRLADRYLPAAEAAGAGR